MKRPALICVLLIAQLFNVQVEAQPVSLENEIEPVELRLQKDAKREGAKLGAVHGVADEDGQYVVVRGHDSFQPVDIEVLSLGAPGGHTVAVSRDNWEKPVETYRIPANSNERIRLRAYGPIGLHIYTAKGESGPYFATVYASPELKDALPKVFVQASQADIEAAGGSPASGGSAATGGGWEVSPVLIVIIALLIVIILLLFVMVLRKRNASLILVFLFASQWLSAQTPISLNTLGEIRTEIEERYANYADSLNDRLGDDASSAVETYVEEVMGLGEIIEAAEAAESFYEQYTGLGECMGAVSEPGMPQIPSMCADAGQLNEQSGIVTPGGRSDCAQCFHEARSEFEETRFLLAKLRLIYTCTNDMAQAAMSFGDDVSGVHAVSGLAWQTERRVIEKSLKEMQQAYDDKYDQLMNRLKVSMMQLDACERQFGLPDWYDRFGYVYFEFMKDRYRRDE